MASTDSEWFTEYAAMKTDSFGGSQLSAGTSVRVGNVAPFPAVVAEFLTLAGAFTFHNYSNLIFLLKFSRFGSELS
jgi:uncharacterized membrane protein YphA (DoxX/SURF4 family)